VGRRLVGGPPITSRSRSNTNRTTAAMNTASITSSEHGQTMAEYSVMLGLILLVGAAVFAALNAAILSLLGRVTGLFA
jgi:Flp pilus assembly pilin Flp